MMKRLIVDDLLYWAKTYHIDGFRFDIMGHLTLDSLLESRKALDALQLDSDGVDGPKIFFYGEGWSFAEMADNARGENAAYHNLIGTGML